MTEPGTLSEARRLRIEARATSLFPGSVAVAVADPCAEIAADLFHVEQSAIEGAVPSRRREFLAGRAAARLAQQALGLPPQRVLMGADRAPIWPEGLSGSISHAGGVCIAAVTVDPTIAALGLDIEDDAALPEELFDSVLHLHEQRWIDRRPDPGRVARIFFSAKECAYKAQYPLSGRVFGFEFITVVPDLDRGTFEARFTRPVSPFSHGSLLAGRFSVGDGLIMTAITLRH